MLLKRIFLVVMLGFPVGVGANGDSSTVNVADAKACEKEARACPSNQGSDIKKPEQGYYQYLLNQFRQVIPGEMDGFAAVVKGANHSRFPYWYLNDNFIFNQYTYDYISARVLPDKAYGSAELLEGKSFNHAYLQVMSAISYGLNEQTKQQLAEHQKELETLASELVDVYEYAFNPIAPEYIEKANQALEPYKGTVETKLDYVVDYAVAFKWSGHAAKDKPPIAFSKLADANNLSQVLPEMPASGAGVLQKLGLYLHSYQVISAISNGFQHNSSMLKAAISNLQSPIHDSGGIKTFNPVDGSESKDYQPRYDIGISLADITNSLNSPDRTLGLTLYLDPEKAKSAQQALAGSLVFVDDVGRSVDLNSLAKAEPIKIEISYQGYVYLPIKKDSLSSDGQSGWYFNDPIWQSIQNQGQDETGYQLIYKPPFNLGCHNQGGNLAELTGVLIANSPKVMITFEGAAKALPSLFVQGSGIGKIQFDSQGPSLGVGQRSYRYRITDGKNGQKSLTFTSDNQREPDSQASTLKASVPLGLRMAEVLLVTYKYPAEQGNRACQI
ncbi:hypothetical protein [Vibrio tetraodonis]|uniref:hypothetical protein n=1 Tax=Vibrio tetraodonis TaxID=2231647 RepID=UPI000E09F802|nr:hypothetical protein [Vibrio tetraodonis]